MQCLHLLCMYVIINDRIIKKENATVSAFNRSFRYGDGFFETMRIQDAVIQLEDLHFERMFRAMQALLFQPPSYYTPVFFREKILLLAKKNNHPGACRVRLMFYRGDGGLYDAENHFPNYVLETMPLANDKQAFNENGLVVDIFPGAKKVYDDFSQIKSNNFLGYAMAALWAKEKKLNDAVLLNSNNRIADATIANIFIVKDGIVKTPSLEEACINGVMRRHVINYIKKENIPFTACGIDAEELWQAKEVFFTNAIYGIRWVRQAGNSFYTNQFSNHLFGQVFS